MEKPWIQYSGSCKMKLKQLKKFHFESQAYYFFFFLFFWEDNQL